MPARVLHRLVIRHPRRDAVFVVRDGGWHLPEVALDERHTAEVEHVNAAVRQQWGLDTVVLAGLEHSQDARGGIRRALALLAEETGNAQITTANDTRLAWMSLDELAHALPKDELALIRTAIAAGNVVDGREWTRPGWWPAVREWIGAQLGDVDIVQIRAWESSCVARVQRRAGDRTAFFFKALPTTGAQEARVSDYLSRLSAPGAPHLYATDLGRRWLLMHAFHGISLDEVRDPSWWERGVATYGRLQAATIDHCDDLRALGCAERRLEDLAAAIEPLLADTQALMPDGIEGLSREQVDAARRLATELRRDCETLVAMDLPAAIDHGDFWPSNILVNDSACAVIDWEDACINQPFLSPGPFIVMLREWRIALPLERVAAAYLAAFADVRPKADLERAFALSIRLALFEMAVRYWRMPTEALALHPWMREMAPLFLRHLLEL